MSEEQATPQPEQQVTKIPKTQFAPEDWALVGVPSENSLKALKAFCVGLLGTPFLPTSLVKNLDSEQQAATLLSVILTGKEMQISAMQSLRSFWMSPDGRLGFYADAMMTVILRSGAKLVWEKLDRDGAVLVTTRGQNTYRAEFLKADADTAGLSNKGTWAKYPKAMFRARVIGETFRSLFADLGGSQLYTKEELQDMDDISDADDRTHSAYISARQSAEQQADKAAEANPALEVKIKPKAKQEQPKVDPPAATAVVDIKPDLPPQEARNEAFLKRVDEAKTTITEAANDLGISDDDLPALNDDSPEAVAAMQKREAEAKAEADAKDKIKVRMAEIIKGVGAVNGKHLIASDIAKFVNSYHHDISVKKTAAQINAALDALQRTISEGPPSVIGMLFHNPTALGKTVRNVGTEADTAIAGGAAPQEDKPAADFIPGFDWGPETVAVARAIISKRRMTEKQLSDALRNFGFKDLHEEDVSIALTLYWFTADTMLLIKRSAEKNYTMRQVLGMMLEQGWLTEAPTLKTSQDAVIKAVTNALTEVVSR